MTRRSVKSPPVERIEPRGGLYSGVAFLTMVAVLFAPVAHRFLHRFHLDIARKA